MQIYMYLGFYFCGVVSYIVSSEHILLMLLSLEFMIISVYVTLLMILVHMINVLYILLFFLVIVVCESALGLSLLVGLTRSFGSDTVFSFVSC